MSKYLLAAGTAVVALALVARGAIALPPVEPIANGTVEGDVGRTIDERMTGLAQKDFSGVVLVARGGKILLAKGYGFADRERKVSYTTETVFDIGSITKPFTAAAILKLGMSGKLAVTDVISKYLPGVPKDKKDITVHHLLTHTAGFTDSLGGDYDRVGREEFIELALASKLLSEPGESYSYSNVGYSLLGAVVELVSGMSYEEYLNQSVFAPAGMTRTGYRLAAWGMDDLASGYQNDRS